MQDILFISPIEFREGKEERPRTNLNARCHVLKFQVHPCVMLLLKGRYVEIGQVWRGEAGSEVSDQDPAL